MSTAMSTSFKSSIPNFVANLVLTYERCRDSIHYVVIFISSQRPGWNIPKKMNEFLYKFKLTHQCHTPPKQIQSGMKNFSTLSSFTVMWTGEHGIQLWGVILLKRIKFIGYHHFHLFHCPFLCQSFTYDIRKHDKIRRNEHGGHNKTSFSSS